MHVNPHWCTCFISAVIPFQCHGPTATPMHETVQPTLPQETVRPTLSQETVRPTLIFAAVIVILVVFIIALAVALTVILVWARRKKQESEIKKLQTAVIDEEVVYDEIQETQLNTPIEMKENDAYQQHIMKASTRVPPHTDNAVVYDEVRVGVTNQGARFMMEENKAYDRHLQRGEGATVSPSDEVEYEEISLQAC